MLMEVLVCIAMGTDFSCLNYITCKYYQQILVLDISIIQILLLFIIFLFGVSKCLFKQPLHSGGVHSEMIGSSRNGCTEDREAPTSTLLTVPFYY